MRLRNPLTSFVLKMLLWLPITVWAWFSISSILTWPLSAITHTVMTGFFPEAIEAIEQQGYLLDVVTRFSAPLQPEMIVPHGQKAVMVFELNTLSYSFNLPFFMALVLASPGTEAQKWFRISLGVGVLLLVQSWGICFDILKTLLHDLGPSVTKQMKFQPWALEIMGLGYQFGYLILPTVAPLLLWVILHRNYLIMIVPNLALTGDKPINRGAPSEQNGHRYRN